MLLPLAVARVRLTARQGARS